MRKSQSNLFWGIIFVLAAALIIAGQLVSYTHISGFSLVTTVILVAVIIQSTRNLNFFGIFIPIAVLYMIYDTPFRLFRFSAFQLFATAILLSIGLGMIVHRKPHWHNYFGDEYRHGQPGAATGDSTPYHRQPSATIDDNNPYFDVSFSGSSQYLHADALKSGQFRCSFGALEIFFDQVTLDPAGAEIFLSVSFGAIKLYVPRSWTVVDNLSTSFGGISNDVRFSRPDPALPRLVLYGTASFAGIEIHYV